MQIRATRDQGTRFGSNTVGTKCLMCRRDDPGIIRQAEIVIRCKVPGGMAVDMDFSSFGWNYFATPAELSVLG